MKTFDSFEDNAQTRLKTVGCSEMFRLFGNEMTNSNDFVIEKRL